MRTALLSVWNKDGLEAFARGLIELGFELLSSGGTARFLKDKGLLVSEVSEYTGFPEMIGGRVKTLHPMVHAGILYRKGRDEKEVEEKKVKGIDVVAVNLYPFEDAVAGGASDEEAIEKIDIGGVALLRAAAKNFERVTAVCDPSDYAGVLKGLRNDSIDNKKLAVKAFARTSEYDAAIASRFGADLFSLKLSKSRDMRYGENPHQGAALYGFNDSFKQVHGKELSYNNLVDVDAAIAMAKEFEGNACIVVKHSNPCGGAIGGTQKEALEKALETDPLSAFGGVFAFNRPLEKEAAEIIAERFTEVVVAPGFGEGAAELFGKKKTVLLDATKAFSLKPGNRLKKVFCGLLVQDADETLYEELKCVTKREPTQEEREALLFAWRFVKHAKSNAIVLAKRSRLVGVGAGQMSRVDAARIAIEKAGISGLDTKGSVLASDAFFPFRDGVDAASKAGVTAIIQPGGSIRDKEVIQAADGHDMTMLFTGIRHFKH